MDLDHVTVKPTNMVLERDVGGSELENQHQFPVLKYPRT